MHALQVARDDGPFGFTLSIGTATFPDDARTREQLVREADRALYAAKRSGRDRAVAVHDLPEEPARGGVDEPAGARPA